MGRASPRRPMPAVELATIVHSGPHDEIDRAYGTLAAHVAEHELAVEGPLFASTTWSAPATLPTSQPGGPRSSWPVFATGTTG